ncbi:HAD family hydrolase [Rhodococcus sp. SORGH_AS_0301]|uniref:HAD family hydrolase n=1 Tax=Rhodococcus sp. SORGH_AS_0301 TaxID=3041780 RepID=UPI0027829AAE|nr:HAD hydrolase-like protein [Rhodococcus sp. SORGH_AS_0301]MDQ1179199.1 FMN phosphatase YigB (HAD superfamily) [Rhodococcus sp. SORGH_AS_0301]
MTDRAMQVLVTDLDNTLWDWFEAWFQPFSAMLTRLADLSGVSQDVLEAEIRQVHQARGTTEYSNLLNEIPALLTASAPGSPADVFDEAQHVLNSRRRTATALYPGVYDALTQIKAAGISIVAYTESTAYWTEWRIKHTNLDGIIDVLYSAPDHELPGGANPQILRTGYLADSEYGLKRTEHHHVPRGVTKPNVEILSSILRDQNCPPSRAVYVGDSLMKDIAMAQSAGVLDVYARYGTVQHKSEYELLRRVTHWPDEDVAREKAVTAATKSQIKPTFTCESRFDEILPLLKLQSLDSTSIHHEQQAVR